MFDPQQISDRLTVVAGVSLLAAVVVPDAFAVEPMLEGGNDAGFDPAAGGAGDASFLVEASGRGFDAAAALVLVLIGVAVLAAVLAAHHASDRRGPLAAR